MTLITSKPDKETRVSGFVSNIREKPVRHFFYILILSVTTYFFAFIFCWGCLTIEWAKQKKDYVVVENVNFDVPWSYTPIRFVSAGVIYAFMYPFLDDASYPDKRLKKEYLMLSTILPTFEESKEIKPGKCCITGSTEYSPYMTIFLQKKDLSQFSIDEKNGFQKLSESPELPGMDKYRGECCDIYLGKRVQGELIRIQCFGHLSDTPSKGKSCIVSMAYRDKFNLNLLFDQIYLSNWQEILQNTEVSLDGFISPSRTPINET